MAFQKRMVHENIEMGFLCVDESRQWSKNLIMFNLIPETAGTIEHVNNIANALISRALIIR